MTPVPLSERNVGWPCYLHRKATTRDGWEREGHPHDHCDNLSDPPMLCSHRFDLVDSTYAAALMADRTPACRKVYEQILDELPRERNITVHCVGLLKEILDHRCIG